MRTVPTIAALALALTLGLVGCASAPATRETAETNATATSAPERDQSSEQNATIESFISATFDDRFEEGLQHASPGSPAERYVTHQQAVLTGMNANGDGYADPATDPTFTFEDGTVKVVEYDQSEYALTDFTFDEDGLVVSWVGKSGPVADVLWTAPWNGQTGGNTINLVSAYRANSGGLFVVLKVAANERTTSVFGYSATYSASDGITYTAETSSQPQEIANGSAGYVILAFPGAPFGGTVNLEGTSPDDYSTSWAASVPVK
ncbi:hypothetical protein RCH16_003591 [Cryobacterium sp. MP_M5]|uniref:hypothetical protein n=1 Tax=unclassified Cryobacterium TaxID=2649013 RepID=UPI0018C919B7|nr:MULTISPECIES: hypothetical protein [unclassified Cryobacterium]MBG6060109.1 hypothetical protein [Cryobacterium sp. MP_M3]MEC5178552.1 hypothetical protein [Cryobacterium sp. MP_M5]